MSIDHFSKNCLKSKFWSGIIPIQHQETINNMSRDFFFLYTIPKPIKPLSSSTMCSIINVWCFLLKHFFFFRSFVYQMNMRFIILDIYPLFIAFILSVRFYYYCDVVLNTLFQPYRILVFQFTRCENVSMDEIRFSNLSEMCVV